MKKYHTLLVTAALLWPCIFAFAAKKSLPILPYPNSVEMKGGVFKIAGATVSISGLDDAKAVAAVKEFVADLSAASGKQSEVRTGDADNGIVFSKETSIPSEGYVIEVEKKKISVRASDFPGIFYAIQTLRQMLPSEIYGHLAAPSADWTVACCRIEDKPRFSYRGTLLDCCRHFWTVEEVKKFIDMMAVYKQNVLHWHLSEDQGWRIEIKKYPELTEIGSWRTHTQVGLDRRPESSDRRPHGGWYSQEEIRDIVAYAENRAITIIPEIDMPGHMVAALASYPWLGCFGKSMEFPGEPYKVRTMWGVSKDVLCLAKPTSLEFVYGVLDEIMELFPSKYIHIGGDECPRTAWEKCSACQAKIAELGLEDKGKTSKESYYQTWFTLEIQKYLAEHGRSIIGWDEIFTDKLSKSATVMNWRDVSYGIQAALAGHDVICCPYRKLYIDYRQTVQYEHEPLSITRNRPERAITIERMYAYEPFTEEMNDEAKAHVIGVQQNLWTEYIATPDHLEYMFAPRCAAAAEIQWCEPGRKDISRLKAALPYHEKLYEQKGFVYSQAWRGISGMPGNRWPIENPED